MRAWFGSRPTPRRRRRARSPEELQQKFYAATARSYDHNFVNPGDEHYVALNFISALIDGFGYTSVLDVGAGTGRGVKHFIDHHPGIHVEGIEPVPEMILEAERKGVPPGKIVEASGLSLPYEDDSFDLVCELGILHHVADPDLIVAEMTRVARRAVCLSDENRFAQGSIGRRLTKYGLYKCGLWPVVFRLAHMGKPYFTTDDGGVAYSYSVYDSLEALAEWGDRLFALPTVAVSTVRLYPLLGATNLLVAAFQDGPDVFDEESRPPGRALR